MLLTRSSYSDEQSIVTRERYASRCFSLRSLYRSLRFLWPTTRSMVQQWQQSATYGHCYIVVPIGALAMAGVNPRRSSQRRITVLPGFALIAVIGFAWWVGELASAAVVMHLLRSAWSLRRR